MDYVVREATRRDIPAIVGLWREMMDYHSASDYRFRFAANAEREVERHIAESLRSRAARIFVAELGDGVVGYILGEVHQRRPIYPVGSYGFVSDISVAESHRRHGVGRALVRTLIVWFQRERVTAIELFAAETNDASMSFWRSMGFNNYLRLLRREL